MIGLLGHTVTLFLAGNIAFLYTAFNEFRNFLSSLKVTFYMKALIRKFTAWRIC